MKNYTLSAFAILIISLSSCSTPAFFLPAVTGNDIAYLPKPMGSDSVKTKNYISASLAGLDLPYNTGSLGMGFVNYSRAHTTKNLNIAYGAFGFAGLTSYDEGFNDKSTPRDFDGKGFAGAGLRTSFGYYDQAGNAEFRILSWENALSFETGGYADFRKEMHDINDPDIISSKRTVMFTTGAASEIIWHGKRNYDNQFAFRLFMGLHRV